MEGKTKALIAFVVLLALIPVLPALKRYLPKPVTVERIVEAFEEAGFEVADIRPGTMAAFRQAADHTAMKVNGAQVDIFVYDDVGKIAKQQQYLRQGPGEAMVEAWNLSEQLGAAPNPNTPSDVARKDMFLLVVTDDNDDLRRRIIQTFEWL